MWMLGIVKMDSKWLSYIVILVIAGVGTSQSSQWDFSGSTLVTSQYVRLTPDERSKEGSIWNTVVRSWLSVHVLI